MAADPNEMRGASRIQVFDAEMIDDPAEQERLNRTLRRPGERFPIARWLIAAVAVVVVLLVGLLVFLLSG